MIFKIKSDKGPGMTWSLYGRGIKSLLISALILTGMQVSVTGQETRYTKPSWYFGASVGANLNYFRGSTHELTSTFIPPAVFHNGGGVGLFLAPIVEFHKPDTRLGFMLQAGLDSRKGAFEQVFTPCNCPADLNAGLRYIAVEPSLRLAPFKTGFYLYAGPRLALNVTKSFVFSQGINPAYPEQVADPDVTGDFSEVDKLILSMQVGAGYDFSLSSEYKKTQWFLSPFVSYHPYFGQNPRSIETWNINTLRVGITLKMGRGHEIPEPPKIQEPMVPVVVEPLVTFSLTAPTIIPITRRVKEIFPLRNYIFFNLGSTEIPDRYVLLTKGQVKDFKEDQLEVYVPKNQSGRSQRQMVVYYNVINILGDRMGKNPGSTIKLVGSSEKGPQDGLAMAVSVKLYLVNVFGIDGSRIATEGLNKPKIPSEKPGGTRELELLREGDQRVSIESGTPAILNEFQAGTSGSMRPVDIFTKNEATMDHLVSFKADGGTEAFTSWSLEITDKNGLVSNFGPFTKDSVSISAHMILKTPDEADFSVTMIGQTKSGKVDRQDSKLHLDLRQPPVPEELTRFSIIYEFDNYKAINIYDKYLTEVIVPKIPKDGKVVINGYTDVIGEEEYNMKLSLDRANDVRKILESGLAKAGRTDVTFEVYGHGEEEVHAPFENKYPEERFYNRTVIIDIVPKG